MNSINEITKTKNLREKLFSMGFLATDSGNAFEHVMSYLEDWNRFKVENCIILIHPKQHCHIYGNRILIGHAYNPFTMETNEEKMLAELNEDSLNQLTGIFTILEVTENGIKVVGDATCMQCTFYGVIDGNYYISTYPNLIGDMLGLEWDPYIKELTEYKFFKLFGVQLP